MILLSAAFCPMTMTDTVLSALMRRWLDTETLLVSSLCNKCFYESFLDRVVWLRLLKRANCEHPIELLLSLKQFLTKKDFLALFFCNKRIASLAGDTPYWHFWRRRAGGDVGMSYISPPEALHFIDFVLWTLAPTPQRRSYQCLVCDCDFRPTFVTVSVWIQGSMLRAGICAVCHSVVMENYVEAAQDPRSNLLIDGARMLHYALVVNRNARGMWLATDARKWVWDVTRRPLPKHYVLRSARQVWSRQRE